MRAKSILKNAALFLIIFAGGCAAEKSHAMQAGKFERIVATVPNQLLGSISWVLTPIAQHAYGDSCFYDYDEEHLDQFGRPVLGYDRPTGVSFLVAVGDSGCKARLTPQVLIRNISPRDLLNIEGQTRLFLSGMFDSASSKESTDLVSASRATGTLLTIERDNSSNYQASFFRQGFFYRFSLAVQPHSEKFRASSIEIWQ